MQAGGLLGLTDDLVTLVIEHACPPEQPWGAVTNATRTRLALVCRWFSALVQTSPRLWEVAYLQANSAQARAAQLTADMQRKSRFVKRLVVDYHNLYSGAVSGLRQLLKQLLAAVSCLEELDLYMIPGTAWTDGLLAGAPGLRRLGIDSMTLSYVPQSIAQLTRLTYLDLRLQLCSPNSLEALGSLASLRHLVLARMQQLPAALTNLRHLTALSLEAGIFREPMAFPENLRSLSALRQFRCKACVLDSTPFFLSAVSTLTHIKFVSCMFEQPLDNAYAALASLAALPSLAEFTLDACMLPKAAAHLRGLQHLQRLDLHSTGMHSLPPGPYLANLTALSLDMSPPWTWRKGVRLESLSSCRRLRQLALAQHTGDDTRFSALPPALVGLEGLTALTLLNLGVEELPEGPYLHSLCRLDLSRNQLATLPPALSTTSSLTYLDLSQNKRLDIASPGELQSFLGHLFARGLRQVSLYGCALMNRTDVAVAVHRLRLERRAI